MAHFAMQSWWPEFDSQNLEWKQRIDSPKLLFEFYMDAVTHVPKNIHIIHSMMSSYHILEFPMKVIF